MGVVRRQLAILTGLGEAGQEDMSSGPRVNIVKKHFALLGRASAYLEMQAWWFVFIFGAALIALVGGASYLMGSTYSFTPFYLVPVALVAWVSGRGAGIAIAAAAGFGWTVVYSYGEPSAQWASLVPYWNIAAQLGIFLVVSLIVSGLRVVLGQEHDLARTDPITGAPNSRAFFEHLDRELVRSLRYGHPFTVAYLDADNFKRINDLYGHTVGDKLLRAVAETVQANIRSADLLARIAGDEFTLLMPETGQKESELVMARVRKALFSAMLTNGWPVTFSMGVVTYSSPPPTVDALLKVADDLMYSVKRDGKNGVSFAVYGERKDAA